MDFRDKIKDLKADPEQGAWQEMSAMLDLNKPPRGLSKLWMFVLVLLLLAIAILGSNILFNNDHNDNGQLSEQLNPTTNNQIEEDISQSKEQSNTAKIFSDNSESNIQFNSDHNDNGQLSEQLNPTTNNQIEEDLSQSKEQANTAKVFSDNSGSNSSIIERGTSSDTNDSESRTNSEARDLKASNTMDSFGNYNSKETFKLDDSTPETTLTERQNENLKPEDARTKSEASSKGVNQSRLTESTSDASKASDRDITKSTDDQSSALRSDDIPNSNFSSESGELINNEELLPSQLLVSSLESIVAIQSIIEKEDRKLSLAATFSTYDPIKVLSPSKDIMEFQLTYGGADGVSPLVHYRAGYRRMLSPKWAIASRYGLVRGNKKAKDISLISEAQIPSFLEAYNASVATGANENTRIEYSDMSTYSVQIFRYLLEKDKVDLWAGIGPRYSIVSQQRIVSVYVQDGLVAEVEAEQSNYNSLDVEFSLEMNVNLRPNFKLSGIFNATPGLSYYAIGIGTKVYF